MKKFDIELAVGIFIIAGIVCLGYLSIRVGQMEIVGGKDYDIFAVFSNSGGLKPGSSVMIAGVPVGKVREVTLENYQARIVLSLEEHIEIQDDAVASIKTRGLIGEKFVNITPGGSETIIPPGGRIRETLPAVDVEQLISNYVFGKI
jgi:phospholipid/cholesterol/gamma-HCH transport system substrate-binding protein